MVWQQPITDARLLGADGARLAAPDWPSPQVMRDFVRGFGPVARRRRGGHEEFPDESVYASAARALRFDPLACRFDAASHGPFTPAVAFRRLLCSDRQAGGVCTRVEVGLSTDANRTGTRLRAWAARAWIDAALELAELPVRVATLRGDGPVASTLWSCGPPLADLYQQATTKSDVPLDEARRRLVTPGAPLVLFEYEAAEREALPDRARHVDPERIGGLDLRFLWIEYRRREFGVWFLARDAARQPLARRVRVGLFRLHAEHQALGTVLGQLLRGEFQYVRGTHESDLFDAYLQAAMRVLGRDQHGGFSHAALQEVIAAYQAVVNPDEQEVLAARLDQVRRQTRLTVTGYSPPAPALAARAALPAPAVERGDAIRVFVSYSHQDAKYLKPGSLVDYVSGGLRHERFDFWYDGNLRGGDAWDERIREELSGADVVLVLVSQAFLNSRYISEVEVAEMIQSLGARGLRVYPVLLRKCDWKTRAWLAGTQAQPRDGKTVEDNYKTRAARDGLFLTILEDLRAVGVAIRQARGAGLTQSALGV